MSENEIPPALSAEDWAAAQKYGADEFRAEAGPRTWFEPDEVAALALQHAAPDGGPLFTWEMVDRQSARAEELEALWMHDEAQPWRDLAARLASLLPPRTGEDR